MTPENDEKIRHFFQRQTTSSEEEKQIYTEFLQFRHKMEPFDPLKPCWQYINDSPYLFWLAQIDYAEILARLAVRIFSTPTNSVSSEQAFSVQNALHDKSRASLEPARVNKLSFVYINSRIYSRMTKIPGAKNPVPSGPAAKLNFNELSNEDEVELEELMMKYNDDVTDKDDIADVAEDADGLEDYEEDA